MSPVEGGEDPRGPPGIRPSRRAGRRRHRPLRFEYSDDARRGPPAGIRCRSRRVGGRRSSNGTRTCRAPSGTAASRADRGGRGPRPSRRARDNPSPASPRPSRRRCRPPGPRSRAGPAGPRPAGRRSPGARTTSSSRHITQGAVPSRFPSFRARAIVSQRLGSLGARRPDHAVHAEPDPVLGLDAALHVVARRREVAAEEEQVNVHQGKSSPAASRSDRGAATGATDVAAVDRLDEPDLLGAHRRRHRDLVAMQHRRRFRDVDDRRAIPDGLLEAALLGLLGERLRVLLERRLDLLDAEDRPGFRARCGASSGRARTARTSSGRTKRVMTRLSPTTWRILTKTSRSAPSAVITSDTGPLAG